MKVSKKTFQKQGKWVLKPTRTPIMVCSCGGKYIKTRDLQVLCIKCINNRVTR